MLLVSFQSSRTPQNTAASEQTALADRLEYLPGPFRVEPGAVGNRLFSIRQRTQDKGFQSLAAARKRFDRGGHGSVLVEQRRQPVHFDAAMLGEQRVAQASDRRTDVLVVR